MMEQQLGYQGETITLEDFVAYAGKLPPNIRRSNEVQFTNERLRALENLQGVSQDNGKITAIGVAKHLPGIVRQSTFGSEIQIPYGWDTERLNFLLMISTPRSSGKYVSYIQGYTEYYDPSVSGKLDPRLKFYMNSIIGVNYYVDPISNMESSRIVHAFNLVYDPIQGKSELVHDQRTVEMLTRPEDIVLGLTMQEYSMDQATVVNNVSRHTMDAKASKFSNNIGVKSFVEVVNGYQTATVMQDDIDMNSHLNAIDLMSETELPSVPFIRNLVMTHMESSPSFFTKSDLDAFFPNIDSIGTIISKSMQATEVSPFTLTGDMDSALSATRESAIANEFSDAVLSSMVPFGLTRVAFFISNMTLDGTITSHPLDEPRSLIRGINKEASMQALLAQLENVIFPNLTEGSLIGLTINATIDALGISIMEITVDGGYSRIIQIGTSANGLYAPVVSGTDVYGHTLDSYSVILGG